MKYTCFDSVVQFFWNIFKWAFGTEYGLAYIGYTVIGGLDTGPDTTRDSRVTDNAYKLWAHVRLAIQDLFVGAKNTWYATPIKLGQWPDNHWTLDHLTTPTKWRVWSGSNIRALAWCLYNSYMSSTEVHVLAFTLYSERGCKYTWEPVQADNQLAAVLGPQHTSFLTWLALKF